jgi:hypothetical protein
MEGFADWRLFLFPGRLFNSISIAVSLFAFWVWLFFSPHKQPEEWGWAVLPPFLLSGGTNRVRSKLAA